MIQTRNQYLQFMLVMLAVWGISWGARFIMEQSVLLYGGNTICSSVTVLFWCTCCVFSWYTAVG